jgi:hypothetical protein
MPLYSVPAIYDGKEITLQEHSPVEGPYHVLVTFVRPAVERNDRPDEDKRFWASFGAWQDERPEEATQ